MAEPIEATLPNRAAFIVDMMALAIDLIPTIKDDYRAHEESEKPSMQVTVGCECDSPDSMSWSYQTGDNSFTGGAYGYAHWGIADLYRDTVPADFAEEIARSLEENEDFDWSETNEAN